MDSHQNFGPVSAVRSLVKIQFMGGNRTLTYYNDRFNLMKNDLVYVTGCFAGKLGKVTEVITRFKIRPSEYEIVIARLEADFHGTFRAFDCNYMFAMDSDLTPSQFRPWVIAPKGKNPYRKKLPPCIEDDLDEDEDEDEYVFGEGYALKLSELEKSEDLQSKIMERGTQYYKEGAVGFLSVREGVVTAYVEGTAWYELNFRLDEDDITELYCDCPYPGLCKHAVAVLLLLRQCLQDSHISGTNDFVIIRKELFWRMVGHGREEIVL